MPPTTTNETSTNAIVGTHADKAPKTHADLIAAVATENGGPWAGIGNKQRAIAAALSGGIYEMPELRVRLMAASSGVGASALASRWAASGVTTPFGITAFTVRYHVLHHVATMLANGERKPADKVRRYAIADDGKVAAKGTDCASVKFGKAASFAFAFGCPTMPDALPPTLVAACWQAIDRHERRDELLSGEGTDG